MPVQAILDTTRFQPLDQVFSDFAGNSGAAFSPLQAVRWELVSVHLIFTADATVVNRIIWIQYLTSGVEFAFAFHPTVHTATQAKAYAGVQGVASLSSTDMNRSVFTLPSNLILGPNDSILIGAANGVAGDTATVVRIKYRQWLAPYNL